MKIADYIDHTLLKATASTAEIKQLCAEAKEYSFYAVCVNGSYVKLAKEFLQASKVKIAAVIGFPLGQMTTKAKVFEAQDAIENGADEIDMVLNIATLKEKKYDFVLAEIAQIKEAIGKDKVLKVIFENCYLEKEDILMACQLSLEAGADFVKTSTGFGTSGATFEQVEMMLKAVDGKAKVKAAGGVRNAEDAEKYIKMGVQRLGTSSGIAILKGQKVEGY